jgi:hypothetical protein
MLLIPKTTDTRRLLAQRNIVSLPNSEKPTDGP